LVTRLGRAVEPRLAALGVVAVVLLGVSLALFTPTLRAVAQVSSSSGPAAASSGSFTDPCIINPTSCITPVPAANGLPFTNSTGLTASTLMQAGVGLLALLGFVAGLSVYFHRRLTR
jgi:hypothetical protein